MKKFGAAGMRLKRAGEFEALLREAFTKDVPVIIDVPIDYSWNDLIYQLL